MMKNKLFPVSNIPLGYSQLLKEAASYINFCAKELMESEKQVAMQKASVTEFETALSSPSLTPEEFLNMASAYESCINEYNQLVYDYIEQIKAYENGLAPFGENGFPYIWSDHLKFILKEMEARYHE